MYKISNNESQKLESKISSRRTNPNRGENSKRHLLGRLDLAISICYSNDANHIRMHRGGTNLQKIRTTLYIDHIKIFAENEKELETLIQSIGIYSQLENKYGKKNRCMYTSSSKLRNLLTI